MWLTDSENLQSSKMCFPIFLIDKSDLCYDFNRASNLLLDDLGQVTVSLNYNFLICEIKITPTDQGCLFWTTI